MDYSKYSIIKFYCTADKPIASLRCGEEITYTLTLTGDGEVIGVPYIHWEICGDDGNCKEGFLDGTSGKISVSGKIEKPGFLRIKAWACDEEKNELKEPSIKFIGGAVACGEECKPTLPTPCDFDEFWEKQIPRLDSTYPDVFEAKEIDSGNQDFRSFILKIRCPEEPCLGFVTGTLTYPRNAEKGSLDIGMGFVGYGLGVTSVSCQKNRIYFHACAHPMEQDREKEYYNAESLGLSGYGLAAEEHIVPETSYFLGMVLRDIQALRFLKTYFSADGGKPFDGAPTEEWRGLWNEENIYMAGGSQGAFQALAMTALVPDRIKACHVRYPWLSNVASVTDETRIISTFLPKFADGIRYFDSASFAERINVPLTIVTGMADTLCLPASMYMVYNAAKGPAKITFIQAMPHGTGGNDPTDTERDEKAKNGYID